MTDKKIILYADDDEPQRIIYGRIISKFFPEFSAEFFKDGSSLEKRLCNSIENVRLVLTDNDMPGVCGSEIIQRYAMKPEFKGIPFILHYGGHKSIGEKAVEDGAFAYLLKPCSLDIISETIKRAIEYSGYQFTASSQ